MTGTGQSRIEELAPDSTAPVRLALPVRGLLAEALDDEGSVDAKNAKMVLGQFLGTDFRHDFRPGNVISLNGHVDIVDRTEQTGAAAGKQLYLTNGDGDKGNIYFREIGTHDLEIPAMG
jgi:hypothetical protein